ncbi:MAG: 50S ribosomal protein L6 [Chloroflexi bacterium]|nr:MAG: 50S ribosomal protein L6 [Chloroflexota bacterium]
MSRIGKAPIRVPNGVKVELKGSTVVVSGPKGTLTQVFHPDMVIELNEGVLTVQRPTDSRQHRSLHGLTRALLNNMVLGVSEGFSKTLEIEGVGYRAEMDGKTLVLNVGYSHPVRFDPPEGIQFAVEDRNKKVIVSGIDKQLVGEIAAKIRKTRPPEPYKGKGIRYAGEVIRRKAGKAGKV